MKTKKKQPAWQLRVIKEKRELDKKLDKLSAFVNSAKFNDFIADDRSLMLHQLSVMDEYSLVLCKRINRFEN